IQKHYLGLVYKGPAFIEGKGFIGNPGFFLFTDIDELPEGADRSLVSPITYVELIYLSGYQDWNTYPNTITRYPATGTDSIVPATTHVKTTNIGEVRYELDANLMVINEDTHVA